MPRFVILEHDHPELHWDFMLEGEGALRTWRLESAPRRGDRIAATPLADHRLAYLDYEGPVSGNRGNVIPWDRGIYELRREDESSIELWLAGEKVHGVVQVTRGEADLFWRWCEDS